MCKKMRDECMYLMSERKHYDVPIAISGMRWTKQSNH